VKGMATWSDMAAENRTAAAELLQGQRWRSAVSRAYYAIYAEITGLLNSAGVSMPGDRGNPSHKRLWRIIGDQLTIVKQPQRSRLADLVCKLYEFRIIADYLPNTEIGQDEARIVWGLMMQAFECLESKQ